MSFRLVPKSVTLNELVRRNGRYFCVISPNSVASRAHCVKVIENVVVKSTRSLSHLLMSFFLLFVAATLTSDLYSALSKFFGRHIGIQLLAAPIGPWYRSR